MPIYLNETVNIHQTALNLTYTEYNILYNIIIIEENTKLILI